MKKKKRENLQIQKECLDSSEEEEDEGEPEAGGDTSQSEILTEFFSITDDSVHVIHRKPRMKL